MAENSARASGVGADATPGRAADRTNQAGELIRLDYRPPFDWEAMLAFLAKRAIPGIERIGAGTYERVVGPAAASTWIRVSHDPAGHRLNLEMSDAVPEIRAQLISSVRAVFDLDADCAAIGKVLSRDSRLKPAIAARPGLRVPGAWDGFELAIRAVLGQQISVAGATTLARRLVDRYGTRRERSFDGLDRAFPSAQRLANARFSGIGLTRARITTIRALSRAVSIGQLPFDPGQTLGEFVARCCAIPGIGPWTAHYIAMRALHDSDAFPAGDLIVRQRLGGASPMRERDAEARSQSWRPWRAYAVLHLWHHDTRPHQG